jgi:DsbC/DsbD-like thiol-disulfide interchange protein
MHGAKVSTVWRGAALATLLAAAPAILLASPAILLASPAMAGDAIFASPLALADHSSARLLSGGPASNGVYSAGVEIDLDPKTITYWRQPGEAGSAPVFDFSRSENVAAVETLYPTPKHIDEAGSIVAGYDARVIFPLRVTPRDAKAPAALKLSLDYAACGKICLPAKAELSLALPRSGASPFASAIAAAQAQVPRKLPPDEAKKLLALERKGDGVWSLRYLGPERALELFPEAPEPLYLDSARGKDDKSFELKLVAFGRAGEKAETGVVARVTIVTEKSAFEAPLRLE